MTVLAHEGPRPGDNGSAATPRADKIGSHSSELKRIARHYTALLTELLAMHVQVAQENRVARDFQRSLRSVNCQLGLLACLKE